jgi:hypothetical protein
LRFGSESIAALSFSIGRRSKSARPPRGMAIVVAWPTLAGPIKRAMVALVNG